MIEGAKVHEKPAPTELNSTILGKVEYTAPRNGAMVGTMQLFAGKEILVVELISMVDSPKGLRMRFRHFSTNLEAYEPRFKQNMRLKEVTPDSYMFENLVPYDKALMSTQPRLTTMTRKGKDEFVAHSDIIGDDGKPAVVEVIYHRVKS